MSRVVAVVIITRGRPEGCRRVVSEVLRQELDDGWTVRVVVVDNNDMAGRLDLGPDTRVLVVHEPITGIPDARNRGVATALPSADVIAFIDDDEVPASSNWLTSLVRPIAEGTADVVTGPVVSLFPEDTPPHIRRQAVFNRRQHSSDETLSVAYTNNAAVRADVFHTRPKWFDTAFRRTGGSDTEFFRRVAREGSRIRWATEAQVSEFVPKDRATARWVLARSRRIGANRIQFLRAQRGSAWKWVTYIVGGLIETALSVMSLAVAPVSRRWALHLLARSFRGLGTLASTVGFHPLAYRRTTNCV